MEQIYIDAHCEVIAAFPNMTPDKFEQLEQQFWEGTAPQWYIRRFIAEMAKQTGLEYARKAVANIGYAV